MNEPRHRTMRLIEKVIPGSRVDHTYRWRWQRADLPGYRFIYPPGDGAGET